MSKQSKQLASTIVDMVYVVYTKSRDEFESNANAKLKLEVFSFCLSIVFLIGLLMTYYSEQTYTKIIGTGLITLSIFSDFFLLFIRKRQLKNIEEQMDVMGENILGICESKEFLDSLNASMESVGDILDAEGRAFSISRCEKAHLDKWMSSIKEKHGKYGGYRYTFTPTGIGVNIEVYSTLEKQTLDITNYEKW